MALDFFPAFPPGLWGSLVQVIHLSKHILSCREQLEMIIPISEIEKLKHQEAKWPEQMQPFSHVVCWLWLYPKLDNKPSYIYNSVQVTEYLHVYYSLYSGQ